jgi:cytochrome c553
MTSFRRTILGLLPCLLAAGCQRAAETSFDGADLSEAPAVLAHGERLSHVLGCTGCHGSGFEGTQMSKPVAGRGALFASNLTLAVRSYDVSDLDRIIRKGIHPVRKTVWRMPSEVFQYLSDRDFHSVLAYLRTLKPDGRPTPPPQFGPADRRDIAAGVYEPATVRIEEYRKSQPVDLGRQYSLGRYITMVSSTACHGPALMGDPANKAPDLIVASAYSRAEFERLATKGIPLGGRKLDPTMYYVALGRLSHMTVHERDALYFYLVARAQQR